MVIADSDRFKGIRRDSLHNEVDGCFDDLEDFEDRNEISPQYRVTHQECVLLNRVLSDKSTLPSACFVPPGAEPAARGASSQRPQEPRPLPEDGETTVVQLVRRITGAVQPVLSSLVTPLHARKKEMGGTITEEQCQALADYLSPSVGGGYLLPTACFGLLKLPDEEQTKTYITQNAEMYARLKKRHTGMAEEGYFPPTMC
ncbi:unnamed protein product [Ectocarpus sp. CCAP 1310/34]|nr:unnamed protein product [Ectocarpus sp. CCAP 1310/34]